MMPILRTLVFAAVVLVASCARSDVTRWQPFTLSEYDLAGRFPPGAVVCDVSSGEHPTGFVARYGVDASCEEPSRMRAGTIGIFATYNAAFYPSPRALFPANCRSGKIARSQIDVADLAINPRSESCWLQDETGSILIYVAAQFGSWRSEDNQSAVGRINLLTYASISSDDQERGIQRFQGFLETVSIG